MWHPTGTSEYWLYLVLLPCKSAIHESWGAARHSAALSSAIYATPAILVPFALMNCRSRSAAMTSSDKLLRQAVSARPRALRIWRENILTTTEQPSKKRVTL